MLETDLGGGVVVQGGFGTDVGADAGEGAVACLVSNGVVGGAAGVSVGDESCAEAVCGVVLKIVEACRSHGGLQDVVDGGWGESSI